MRIKSDEAGQDLRIGCELRPARKALAFDEVGEPVAEMLGDEVDANASVGERVANALMLRDQAAERMREREAYVLRRTAALLESTGYTTVDRAAAEARRELAVVLAGGGS